MTVEVPMSVKCKAIPEGAIKAPIPDTRQGKGYSCGASALKAICGYFGVGPEEEEDYGKDLKMDTRVGSHPFQIIRAAKRYSLRVSKKKRMNVNEVKASLDRGKPVMLMIQAWRDSKTEKSYETEWGKGHWVVAIGYDRAGMYFEDPSLATIRGFISYTGLEERWHDTGPRNRRMEHYGLAVWKSRMLRPAYLMRARWIP
jgi:predicted double-glycine peptidase